VKNVFWLAAAMASLAAQTSVTGPELGMVYDTRVGGLRSIRGIPASAVLAQPVPADLEFAVASAQDGFALGVERGTGATVIVSASGRLALTETRTGAARIALGPRGRTAAIYFGGSLTVQVVAGLPSAPRVMRELELEAKPSALAVSDDGELLLATLERDGEDSLLLFAPGMPPTVLLHGSRLAALEFLPESRDALAAGAEAVWLVRDGNVSPLLDRRDGVTDPVGVGASGDGLRVIVAMRGGQVLLRDLAGGSPTVLSCNCEPTGLARLRGNAVFRLTDPASGTVWLLDGDAAEAHIVFVANGGESRP
jgi:hypothetical protein